MKINPQGHPRKQAAARPRAARSAKARAAREPPPAAAAGTATDAGSSPADRMPAHIRRLLERVSDRGQALVSDPGFTALEAYKLAVREFLQVTLEEGLRVRAETPGIFSRKVFATVARVDLDLVQLTDEVMSAQCSVVKLSRMVEEIKGLLIDLYR